MKSEHKTNAVYGKNSTKAKNYVNESDSRSRKKTSHFANAKKYFSSIWEIYFKKNKVNFLIRLLNACSWQWIFLPVTNWESFRETIANRPMYFSRLKSTLSRSVIFSRRGSFSFSIWLLIFTCDWPQQNDHIFFLG